MSKPALPPAERGFTIVELLVATAVFAILLLVVMTAVMQFTRVYYRGITESTTQDTARSVVDRITQSIQFNGGDVSETPAGTTAGTSYAFCAGNQQYSYTLGTQLADSPTATQTPHALVVRDIAGCTGLPAQNVRNAAATGRELLAPKMRLSRLSIQSLSDSLYRVHVRVVYGDDDLLLNANAADARCKPGAGSQFCAVSDISTTISKRVE